MKNDDSRKIRTLKASKLKKIYNERISVNDISLEISSNEIVGLLGPNGSGKTTIFYMILGLVPVDSGLIEIDSTNITNFPIHKRSRMGLSYLPQEASIFRNLNVEQNIKAILEISSNKSLSKNEINHHTDLLLEELQITRLRKAMALSLSGGERRRVEIARALATNPKFLLLDEPFAGVDPVSIIEIQQIITFLKNRGVGVLITDHNVRETLKICNRAYIINNGKVVTSGSPSEIVTNHSVIKVYLGNNFQL
ncbi:LPS export ABC transporter ATP-binding protein [Candidatus Kinetoplastidibacterium crithidiae]|uniref:Lipopolysaccharide export system ATP-binding protein n=1 Tax=Candidatus Kinetoplastidibacterium crithidiae TCC036E TaxID=1208918 RepID=M1LQQ5_9PROT|nr:LPS export ABC transporter ATP-binding protein [Candidatus Kinetoplastibacterium crithidii]AFZ82932.1 lipopolysaccharide export system ATP-binding protein [Candidatus Kinetoplastibacterium crithidii (ex Angomonas deanei ATCC 30255)]AGF47932.1 lipopolysaccharide export system ATP-binding protein [Candidatus Kinetoplastibacterium crithidii TCC036E]